MRLLFISNVFPNPLQPTRGTFNLELVRALARDHQVRVISPVAWTDEWRLKRQGGRVMPTGRTATPDGVPGVEAHFPRYFFTPKVLRGRYGWFMWRSVRAAVRRQLEAFRPQAVIGYWAHPDGEVAVRAARLAGVPAAVMVGGSDVLLLTESPGRRRHILGVLHAADAVIPVSQDLKTKLVQFGLPVEKVHVVPRGVDMSRFAPGDAADARRRLNIPADLPAVLWVGRMVPVKGLEVLIEACDLLRRGGTPFRVYLVGDGPLRESLRADAAARGLSDVVSFVGSVAHAGLGDWYRAADLTVLPSHSEGIPNVLRESLACGTPFVASRVGGIAEIADEASCTLVPPGDAAALAAALRSSLGRRGGARGGVPVRQKGWAESAESLAQVLRPLVKPDNFEVHDTLVAPPHAVAAGEGK